MATKEYVSIFVPRKLRNKIKIEAAKKGMTMIEELKGKYNIK